VWKDILKARIPYHVMQKINMVLRENPRFMTTNEIISLLMDKYPTTKYIPTANQMTSYLLRLPNIQVKRANANRVNMYKLRQPIKKAMNLKIVGYWGNWGDDTKMPKPNSATYDVQTIADKLKNADYIRGYRGVTVCRICRERLGAGELTNYEYVFPDSLYHYVEKHEVALPDFLINSLMEEHTPNDLGLESVKRMNDNNLPKEIIGRYGEVTDIPISSQWSSWLEQTGLSSEEALEQYDLTAEHRRGIERRMGL